MDNLYDRKPNIIPPILLLLFITRCTWRTFNLTIEICIGASDKRAMAQIDELLKLMVKERASDLHISSGSPPCLRIHGDMVQTEYRPLSNQECQNLIFEILSAKQKKSFIDNWELDCSYSIEGLGRFRCNVFMQRKGMGGVFRIIPEKILTVEELKLPIQVLTPVEHDHGLVLVTGPTGSGKSTTLAAMIDYINRTKKGHIITIEDPIEFVHENKNCLINQREVNSHTKSFANALKSALREDPDIILVGEMRDLETISLALTAAETGHLVFGTLHTNSATKTIDRIIDVFPPEQQEQIRVMLSESLLAVIAQTLIKLSYEPGRVALLEVLLNNKAIANLIREGKTFQILSALQTGINQGMLTYEHSMKKLVDQKLISPKDAAAFFSEAKEPQPTSTTTPPPQSNGPTKPLDPAIANLLKKKTAI